MHFVDLQALGRVYGVFGQQFMHLPLVPLLVLKGLFHE
jgi:hypothetical protein